MAPFSGKLLSAMFLRAKIRKKDGKKHRYFSVVANWYRWTGASMNGSSNGGRKAA